MLRKKISDRKNEKAAKNFKFGNKTILDEMLTTEGRYAMAGLCTVSLSSMFPDEQWKEFNRTTITDLLEYLKLPTEKFIAMLEPMLDFGTHHPETYHCFTSLINDEEHCNENLIVQDLVYFALRQGCYDSRLRVMIKTAISCFQELPLDGEYNLLEIFEELFISECFTGGHHELTEEQHAERMKLIRRRKVKSAVAIGTSTVILGALMGCTGGLAAPMIGLSGAALFPGLTGSFLASAGGMALIGSLFAITGSGLGGYKMNRRLRGEMETFKFEILTNITQLHVTIAISGWLPQEQGADGFREPWKTLWHSKEQYFLVYETSHLMRLGQALGSMYRKIATNAVQRTLARTVMSGLMAAIALPAYLRKLADIIDNPWGVCTSKAEMAGQELADALQSRAQGKRPVSLIGFSIGARVIFYCLQELALRKDCENIVQDAVMLGAPVTAVPAEWNKLCKVVSGRIVNGYSTNDWMLRLAHRASAATLNVAGLQRISLDDRRMDNIDLTDIVEGHLDYPNKMPEILKKLGIRVHGGDHLIEKRQEPNSVFYVSHDEDGEEGASVEMKDLGMSAAHRDSREFDGSRYENNVIQDVPETISRTNNSTFFVSLNNDNYNDPSGLETATSTHELYNEDSDEEHFADALENVLLDFDDD